MKQTPQGNEQLMDNTPPAVAMSRIENAAFLRDAAWVSLLLEEAQKNRFHGQLTLIMEKGLVMRVVENKSLMPPHRLGA